MLLSCAGCLCTQQSILRHSAAHLQDPAESVHIKTFSDAHACPERSSLGYQAWSCFLSAFVPPSSKHACIRASLQLSPSADMKAALRLPCTHS